MKKFAAILAAMAIAFVFVGCAPKEETTTTTTPDANSTTTTDAPETAK